MAALALGSLGACARANEPSVIARDLAGPTAVVVRRIEGPGGAAAFDLYVAEAAAGRVTRVRVGTEESPTVVAEGLADGGLALALAGDKTLIVGEVRTGRLLRVGLDQATPPSALREFERGDAAAPSGRLSIAVTDRYLFASRGSELTRARVTGEELTTLRPFPAKANADAIATSSTGYLLAIGSGQKRPTLSFLDPHAADAGIASVPVEGFDSAVAIVEGPTPRPAERLLYALVRSIEPGRSGVYRLDASAGGSAQASLVQSIDSPLALAFAPDGSLLVATGTIELGEVVRFAGAW